MASPPKERVGKAFAESIGGKIREARKCLGITQAQLAVPTYSTSYISAVERGKVCPTLFALSTLAKRLDIPLALLLEGTADGVGMPRIIEAAPEEAVPELKVEVALQLVDALLMRHSFEEVEALLKNLQHERFSLEQAYTLHILLGRLHLETGAYQAAEQCFRDAIAKAEDTGNSEYVERARNLLGLAYFLLGDYQMALKIHIACANALEQEHIIDPFLASEVYSNLAGDYFSLGEETQAEQLYGHALELFKDEQHDSLWFAGLYLELGLAFHKAGKLALALEFAGRARLLYWMREEQKSVGLTHQCLGKVREKQGDFDGALQEYQAALKMVRAIRGDPAAASFCYTSLAELSLVRGNVPVAGEYAQEALILARSCDDQQTQAQALLALGAIRHAVRDYTAADQFFEQALELLDRSQAHELTARAYYRYAHLLEDRKEIARSLQAAKKAFELRSKSAVA